MSDQIKRYGTNNEKAYKDLCAKSPTGGKHKWIAVKAGRCIESCHCEHCGSTCSWDSSD